MATFIVGTTPGAAYQGTAEDDTFIVPSYDAWIAAGRTIDGLGGFDTLLLNWPVSSAINSVVNDAEFAGIANLEALTQDGSRTTFPTINMAALASASYANGVTVTGAINLRASGMTVPVTFSEGGGRSDPSTVVTGFGDDVIRTSAFFPGVTTGPGDDRIFLLSRFNSPFTGGFMTGSVFAGTGYDIIIGVGPGAAITASAQPTVTGVEEIWTSTRFNLIATTSTELTGLDGNGNRNPLVLRPDGGGLNIYASDDGRPSYDGRIQAYGTAVADTVRGSATGDHLEGGGGADSLSGEGGNDWLVFQNTAQLAAAAAVAGGAGYDILALKDADQTVTDADFARATGMEELRFLGTGVQDVTLGANSDAAFAASSFGAGSVSAPDGGRIILNAGIMSNAMSVYGTAADIFRLGAGRDYVEINGRGGTNSVGAIVAGSGADHVRFNTGFAPGATVNGGASYDVLMMNNDALASLSVPPSRPPMAPMVSGFEELRIMGEGAISVTLTDRFLGNPTFATPPTDRFIFSGSETGYGTIQAPNAASLAINLRDLTVGIALYGTPGADVVTATATANDYLFGGAGADQFRFDRQCGVDVVADFVSGTDKLALLGFAGIGDFAAVQARAAVVGGNLQISLTPTDGIILAGVTSIAAGDFLFS